MCIRDRLAAGGLVNPGAILDGRPGEPPAADPLLAPAGGPGGAHFPPEYPRGVLPQDWNDLDITDIFSCSSNQIGSPGGGAAHALDGGQGLAVTPVLPTLLPPEPAPSNTPGGSVTPLGLGPAARSLDPELGFLRAGSGGGGGGGSIYGTRTNGLPFNCDQPFPPLGQLTVMNYVTHSSAGGGGAAVGLSLIHI